MDARSPSRPTPLGAFLYSFFLCAHNWAQIRKHLSRSAFFNNWWSWEDAAAYWDAAPDSKTPDQEMDAETREELSKFFKAA